MCVQAVERESTPPQALERLRLELQTTAPLQDLASLARLTSLQSLSLAGSGGVTDQALAVLSPLGRTLTELSLRDCWAITGEGLMSLCPYSRLQSLDLRGLWQLNDQDLAVLCMPGFSGLTRLSLARCDELTSAALQIVERSSASLLSLDLSDLKALLAPSLFHVLRCVWG